MSIEIKISRRRISYINAMKLLNKRVAEIKNKEKSDLLWVLEHPVTYTAGIRYNRNEILDKKIKCKMKFTDNSWRVNLIAKEVA